MILDRTVLEGWTNYVLEQYPKEACAFVVDGILHPVQNLSETPEQTFKVDTIERLKLEQTGKLQAFLHSHPYKIENSPFKHDPTWASHADMVTWISDNIPWGISSTDGEGVSEILWYDENEVAPLEGREFISGKYDCLSLVRDYYKQVLGITFPNYPRGMDWWEEVGVNHYEDCFPKAGFFEVPLSEIKVNDLVLMKVVGDVLSHSAVVTDTNTIMHHMIGRLSGYDTMAKWNRFIVKAIRHKDLADKS